MHQIFFLLVLVFLPTQLGIHFWPDWAFVLGRRVDYLSPTLYFTDILIFFTVLFWFFESPIRIRVNKAVVLFLVFVSINIWTSTNQPVAVYKWIKVLEFGLLGWYIIKTKPKLSHIAFCLSLGILYSSFIAISQFILQRSIGGVLWLLGERTFTVDTPGIARINWNGGELLRPYATFPHPNVLAGYIAVTLPFLIIQLSKFYSIVFMFGLITLLLTFSRSGWFAGGAGIIFAYLVLRKYKVFSAIPLFIILVLIALYVFAQIPVTNESIVVRTQLNSAAITIWQQSPFFGVGLGNFLVQLPNALPSRTIYFLQPVHNIYLLVLAEAGIMGFGFFIFLLWKGLRNSTSSPLRVALGSVLLLGLVDHYFLTLQQGQLLFTILLALNLLVAFDIQ